MSGAREFEHDADVRQILADNGIYEAHRLIAEYKCERTRKDGGNQEVLVRIYDMGPDHPKSRYSWKVSVPLADEPGPVYANPADTVYKAGDTPHWHMLDTDARKGPE